MLRVGMSEVLALRPLGPKLAEKVCLICINFCCQEAGGDQRMSPHQENMALVEIPSLLPIQASLQLWPPWHRAAFHPTLLTAGQNSSQRIFPRSGWAHLPHGSIPGPQHHQLPAAVKCQKLNLFRYGSNSSLCHTKKPQNVFLNLYHQHWPSFKCPAIKQWGCCHCPQ